MSNPTVYITQEKTRRDPANGRIVPQFDFRPAMKYGKLEVLLPGGYSLMAPVPTIRLLNEKLDQFCDDDYLLAVGDPTVMVAAAMVASRINSGRLKLLKWDREVGDYVPVQIDISGRAV